MVPYVFVGDGTLIRAFNSGLLIHLVSNFLRSLCNGLGLGCLL